MIEHKAGDWHKTYQDALSETDAKRLSQVIADAESVMFLRWQVLPGSPNERGERVEIHNALNALRLLKTNKPKSQGK